MGIVHFRLVKEKKLYINIYTRINIYSILYIYIYIIINNMITQYD